MHIKVERYLGASVMRTRSFHGSINFLFFVHCRTAGPAFFYWYTIRAVISLVWICSEAMMNLHSDTIVLLLWVGGRDLSLVQRSSTSFYSCLLQYSASERVYYFVRCYIAFFSWCSDKERRRELLKSYLVPNNHCLL